MRDQVSAGFGAVKTAEMTAEQVIAVRQFCVQNAIAIVGLGQDETSDEVLAIAKGIEAYLLSGDD